MMAWGLTDGELARAVALSIAAREVGVAAGAVEVPRHSADVVVEVPCHSPQARPGVVGLAVTPE